jgi:hypothetical protein
MIYLTIQPELHVYQESMQESGVRSQEDLVTTTETIISQNPLNVQRTVNVLETAEALSARNIHLTEPTDYKGTIFVKSNLPVDTYSDDLSVESNGSGDYYEYYDVWLRLKEQIRMTRKIGSSEYKWNDGYGSYPIIKTDTQGKYSSFISGNNESGYETALLDYPYYGAVELGLEKPPLTLPLTVQSAMQLYGRAVDRYTGNAETIEKTVPIVLPLLAILKSAHTINITPPIITLNEDNNYTSFLAVEANDGADWSFQNVDPRITVTPASGTGRTAVIVKEAGDRSQELEGEGNYFFENVPLTIVSSVNPVIYPDIDGNYEVSDTAHVHVEQYTPTRNALVPKMESETAAGVAITPLPNDTANELNAEYTHSTSNYASFAINSADDVLTIDAGEAVVLDKIEIRSQNVRRLVAPNTYKGGAAIAFSLYGTNDPDGTWTLLRNGANLTDISAITGTTSTVGSWVWGSTTTTTIVNGFAARNCPSCGTPMTFCTVCGQVSCPNFDFEEYYNYGNTCSNGHDVWGRHYDLHWNPTSHTPVTPPDHWTTAYRYYKLVPVNRSTGGVEMACSLFSVDIHKRVSATQVSIPAAT